MSDRLSKRTFQQLLDIGESVDGTIIEKLAKQSLGNDFDRLREAGALLHVNNLKDVAVSEGETEITTDVVRQDGKNMHFSASDGFVGVLDEDIALYKINFEWLTREIMSALEMPQRRQATSILTDHIWMLGEHRLVKKQIAIVLARGIRRSVVFGTLRAHLKDNHSARDPALVLSMDRHHTEHFQLPRQNTLVRLREVLVMERQRFEINLPLLEVKLGGTVSRDGFSSGYRVLIRNGEEFNFTPKQADVMEYLHKENGPRHRDEILAAVNSTAKRLLDVFRQDGKPIPAWGTVIKHDNRGFYRLDL